MSRERKNEPQHTRPTDTASLDILDTCIPWDCFKIFRRHVRSCSSDDQRCLNTGFCGIFSMCKRKTTHIHEQADPNQITQVCIVDPPGRAHPATSGKGKSDGKQVTQTQRQNSLSVGRYGTSYTVDKAGPVCLNRQLLKHSTSINDASSERCVKPIPGQQMTCMDTIASLSMSTCTRITDPNTPVFFQGCCGFATFRYDCCTGHPYLSRCQSLSDSMLSAKKEYEIVFFKGNCGYAAFDSKCCRLPQTWRYNLQPDSSSPLEDALREAGTSLEELAKSTISRSQLDTDSMTTLTHPTQLQSEIMPTVEQNKTEITNEQVPQTINSSLKRLEEESFPSGESNESAQSEQLAVYCAYIGNQREDHAIEQMNNVTYSTKDTVRPNVNKCLKIENCSRHSSQTHGESNQLKKGSNAEVHTGDTAGMACVAQAVMTKSRKMQPQNSSNWECKAEDGAPMHASEASHSECELQLHQISGDEHTDLGVVLLRMSSRFDCVIPECRRQLRSGSPCMGTYGVEEAYVDSSELPAAIPESTAISESPAAILDSPTAILESPPAIPESPAAISVSPAAMQESPAASPESHADIPESPAAMLESPAAMPESPTAIPESHAAMPESHAAISTRRSNSDVGESLLTLLADGEYITSVSPNEENIPARPLYLEGGEVSKRNPTSQSDILSQTSISDSFELGEKYLIETLQFDQTTGEQVMSPQASESFDMSVEYNIDVTASKDDVTDNPDDRSTEEMIDTRKYEISDHMAHHKEVNVPARFHTRPNNGDICLSNQCNSSTNSTRDIIGNDGNKSTEHSKKKLLSEDLIAQPISSVTTTSHNEVINLIENMPTSVESTSIQHGMRREVDNQHTSYETIQILQGNINVVENRQILFETIPIQRDPRIVMGNRHDLDETPLILQGKGCLEEDHHILYETTIQNEERNEAVKEHISSETPPNQHENKSVAVQKHVSVQCTPILQEQRNVSGNRRDSVETTVIQQEKESMGEQNISVEATQFPQINRSVVENDRRPSETTRTENEDGNVVGNRPVSVKTKSILEEERGVIEDQQISDKTILIQQKNRSVVDKHVSFETTPMKQREKNVVEKKSISVQTTPLENQHYAEDQPNLNVNTVIQKERGSVMEHSFIESTCSAVTEKCAILLRKERTTAHPKALKNKQVPETSAEQQGEKHVTKPSYSSSRKEHGNTTTIKRQKCKTQGKSNTGLRPKVADEPIGAKKQNCRVSVKVNTKTSTKQSTSGHATLGGSKQPTTRRRVKNKLRKTIQTRKAIQKTVASSDEDKCTSGQNWNRILLDDNDVIEVGDLQTVYHYVSLPHCDGGLYEETTTSNAVMFTNDGSNCEIGVMSETNVKNIGLYSIDEKQMGNASPVQRKFGVIDDDLFSFFEDTNQPTVEGIINDNNGGHTKDSRSTCEESTKNSQDGTKKNEGNMYTIDDNVLNSGSDCNQSIKHNGISLMNNSIQSTYDTNGNVGDCKGPILKGESDTVSVVTKGTQTAVHHKGVDGNIMMTTSQRTVKKPRAKQNQTLKHSISNSHVYKPSMQRTLNLSQSHCAVGKTSSIYSTVSQKKHPKECNLGVKSGCVISSVQRKGLKRDVLAKATKPADKLSLNASHHGDSSDPTVTKSTALQNMNSHKRSSTGLAPMQREQTKKRASQPAKIKAKGSGQTCITVKSEVAEDTHKEESILCVQKHRGKHKLPFDCRPSLTIVDTQNCSTPDASQKCEVIIAKTDSVLPCILGLTHSDEIEAVRKCRSEIDIVCVKDAATGFVNRYQSEASGVTDSAINDEESVTKTLTIKDTNEDSDSTRKVNTIDIAKCHADIDNDFFAFFETSCPAPSNDSKMICTQEERTTNTLDDLDNASNTQGQDEDEPHMQLDNQPITVGTEDQDQICNSDSSVGTLELTVHKLQEETVGGILDGCGDEVSVASSIVDVNHEKFEAKSNYTMMINQYEASDSNRVQEASDSNREQEASDSNSVQEASDSKIVQEASDSNSVQEASDSNRIQEASDSNRVQKEGDISEEITSQLEQSKEIVVSVKDSSEIEQEIGVTLGFNSEKACHSTKKEMKMLTHRETKVNLQDQVARRQDHTNTRTKHTVGSGCEMSFPGSMSDSTTDNIIRGICADHVTKCEKTDSGYIKQHRASETSDGDYKKHQHARSENNMFRTPLKLNSTVHAEQSPKTDILNDAVIGASCTNSFAEGNQCSQEHSRRAEAAIERSEEIAKQIEQSKYLVISEKIPSKLVEDTSVTSESKRGKGCQATKKEKTTLYHRENKAKIPDQVANTNFYKNTRPKHPVGNSCQMSSPGDISSSDYQKLQQVICEKTISRTPLQIQENGTFHNEQLPETCIINDDALDTSIFNAFAEVNRFSQKQTAAVVIDKSEHITSQMQQSKELVLSKEDHSPVLVEQAVAVTPDSERGKTCQSPQKENNKLIHSVSKAKLPANVAHGEAYQKTCPKHPVRSSCEMNPPGEISESNTDNIVIKKDPSPILEQDVAVPPFSKSGNTCQDITSSPCSVSESNTEDIIRGSRSDTAIKCEQGYIKKNCASTGSHHEYGKHQHLPENGTARTEYLLTAGAMIDDTSEGQGTTAGIEFNMKQEKIVRNQHSNEDIDECRVLDKTKAESISTHITDDTTIKDSVKSDNEILVKVKPADPDSDKEEHDPKSGKVCSDQTRQTNTPDKSVLENNYESELVTTGPPSHCATGVHTNRKDSVESIPSKCIKDIHIHSHEASENLLQMETIIEPEQSRCNGGNELVKNGAVAEPTGPLQKATDTVEYVSQPEGKLAGNKPSKIPGEAENKTLDHDNCASGIRDVDNTGMAISGEPPATTCTMEKDVDVPALLSTKSIDVDERCDMDTSEGSKSHSTEDVITSKYATQIDEPAGDQKPRSVKRNGKPKFKHLASIKADMVCLRGICETVGKRLSSSSVQISSGKTSHVAEEKNKTYDSEVVIRMKMKNNRNKERCTQRTDINDMESLSDKIKRSQSIRMKSQVFTTLDTDANIITSQQETAQIKGETLLSNAMHDADMQQVIFPTCAQTLHDERNTEDIDQIGDRNMISCEEDTSCYIDGRVQDSIHVSHRNSLEAELVHTLEEVNAQVENQIVYSEMPAVYIDQNNKSDIACKSTSNHELNPDLPDNDNTLVLDSLEGAVIPSSQCDKEKPTGRTELVEHQYEENNNDSGLLTITEVFVKQSGKDNEKGEMVKHRYEVENDPNATDEISEAVLTTESDRSSTIHSMCLNILESTSDDKAECHKQKGEHSSELHDALRIDDQHDETQYHGRAMKGCAEQQPAELSDAHAMLIITEDCSNNTLSRGFCENVKRGLAGEIMKRVRTISSDPQLSGEELCKSTRNPKSSALKACEPIDSTESPSSSHKEATINISNLSDGVPCENNTGQLQATFSGSLKRVLAGEIMKKVRTKTNDKSKKKDRCKNKRRVLTQITPESEHQSSPSITDSKQNKFTAIKQCDPNDHTDIDLTNDDRLALDLSNNNRDLDPSNNQHADIDPSNDQHADIEPSNDQHADIDPSNHQHTDIDPNNDQHADIDPINDQHADIDPSNDQHADIDPINDQHADIDPNNDQHADIDPINDQHADIDPSNDQHADIDPSNDQHADIDPNNDNQMYNVIDDHREDGDLVNDQLQNIERGDHFHTGLEQILTDFSEVSSTATDTRSTENVHKRMKKQLAHWNGKSDIASKMSSVNMNEGKLPRLCIKKANSGGVTTSGLKIVNMYESMQDIAKACEIEDEATIAGLTKKKVGIGSINQKKTKPDGKCKRIKSSTKGGIDKSLSNSQTSSGTSAKQYGFPRIHGLELRNEVVNSDTDTEHRNSPDTISTSQTECSEVEDIHCGEEQIQRVEQSKTSKSRFLSLDKLSDSECLSRHKHKKFLRQWKNNCSNINRNRTVSTRGNTCENALHTTRRPESASSPNNPFTEHFKVEDHLNISSACTMEGESEAHTCIPAENEDACDVLISKKKTKCRKLKKRKLKTSAEQSETNDPMNANSAVHRVEVPTAIKTCLQDNAVGKNITSTQTLLKEPVSEYATENGVCDKCDGATLPISGSAGDISTMEPTEKSMEWSDEGDMKSPSRPCLPNQQYDNAKEEEVTTAGFNSSYIEKWEHSKKNKTCQSSRKQKKRKPVLKSKAKKSSTTDVTNSNSHKSSTEGSERNVTEDMSNFECTDAVSDRSTGGFNVEPISDNESTKSSQNHDLELINEPHNSDRDMLPMGGSNTLRMCQKSTDNFEMENSICDAEQIETVDHYAAHKLSLATLDIPSDSESVNKQKQIDLTRKWKKKCLNTNRNTSVSSGEATCGDEPATTWPIDLTLGSHLHYIPVCTSEGEHVQHTYSTVETQGRDDVQMKTKKQTKSRKLKKRKPKVSVERSKTCELQNDISSVRNCLETPSALQTCVQDYEIERQMGRVNTQLIEHVFIDAKENDDGDTGGDVSLPSIVPAKHVYTVESMAKLENNKEEVVKISDTESLQRAMIKQELSYTSVVISESADCSVEGDMTSSRRPFITSQRHDNGRETGIIPTCVTSLSIGNVEHSNENKRVQSSSNQRKRKSDRKIKPKNSLINEGANANISTMVSASKVIEDARHSEVMETGSDQHMGRSKALSIQDSKSNASSMTKYYSKNSETDLGNESNSDIDIAPMDKQDTSMVSQRSTDNFKNESMHFYEDHVINVNHSLTYKTSFTSFDMPSDGGGVGEQKQMGCSLNRNSNTGVQTNEHKCGDEPAITQKLESTNSPTNWDKVSQYFKVESDLNVSPACTIQSESVHQTCITSEKQDGGPDTIISKKQTKSRKLKKRKSKTSVKITKKRDRYKEAHSEMHCPETAIERYVQDDDTERSIGFTNIQLIESVSEHGKERDVDDRKYSVNLPNTESAGHISTACSNEGDMKSPRRLCLPNQQYDNAREKQVTTAGLNLYYVEEVEHSTENQVGKRSRKRKKRKSARKVKSKKEGPKEGTNSFLHRSARKCSASKVIEDIPDYEIASDEQICSCEERPTRVYESNASPGKMHDYTKNREQELKNESPNSDISIPNIAVSDTSPVSEMFVGNFENMNCVEELDHYDTYKTSVATLDMSLVTESFSKQKQIGFERKWKMNCLKLNCNTSVSSGGNNCHEEPSTIHGTGSTNSQTYWNKANQHFKLGDRLNDRTACTMEGESVQQTGGTVEKHAVDDGQTMSKKHKKNRKLKKRKPKSASDKARQKLTDPASEEVDDIGDGTLRPISGSVGHTSTRESVGMFESRMKESIQKVVLSQEFSDTNDVISKPIECSDEGDTKSPSRQYLMNQQHVSAREEELTFDDSNLSITVEHSEENKSDPSSRKQQKRKSARKCKSDNSSRKQRTNVNLSNSLTRGIPSNVIDHNVKYEDTDIVSDQQVGGSNIRLTQDYESNESAVNKQDYSKNQELKLDEESLSSDTDIPLVDGSDISIGCQMSNAETVNEQTQRMKYSETHQTPFTSVDMSSDGHNANKQSEPEIIAQCKETCWNICTTAKKENGCGELNSKKQRKCRKLIKRKPKTSTETIIELLDLDNGENPAESHIEKPTFTERHDQGDKIYMKQRGVDVSPIEPARTESKETDLDDSTSPDNVSRNKPLPLQKRRHKKSISYLKDKIITSAKPSSEELYKTETQTVDKRTCIALAELELYEQSSVINAVLESPVFKQQNIEFQTIISAIPGSINSPVKKTKQPSEDSNMIKQNDLSDSIISCHQDDHDTENQKQYVGMKHTSEVTVNNSRTNNSRTITKTGLDWRHLTKRQPLLGRSTKKSGEIPYSTQHGWTSSSDEHQTSQEQQQQQHSSVYGDTIMKQHKDKFTLLNAKLRESYKIGNQTIHHDQYDKWSRCVSKEDERKQANGIVTRNKSKISLSRKNCLNQVCSSGRFGNIKTSPNKGTAKYVSSINVPVINSEENNDLSELFKNRHTKYVADDIHEESAALERLASLARIVRGGSVDKINTNIETLSCTGSSSHVTCVADQDSRRQATSAPEPGTRRQFRQKLLSRDGPPNDNDTDSLSSGIFEPTQDIDFSIEAELLSAQPSIVNDTHEIINFPDGRYLDAYVSSIDKSAACTDSGDSHIDLPSGDLFSCHGNLFPSSDTLSSDCPDDTSSTNSFQLDLPWWKRSNAFNTLDGKPCLNTAAGVVTKADICNLSDDSRVSDNARKYAEICRSSDTESVRSGHGTLPSLDTRTREDVRGEKHIDNTITQKWKNATSTPVNVSENRLDLFHRDRDLNKDTDETLFRAITEETDEQLRADSSRRLDCGKRVCDDSSEPSATRRKTLQKQKENDEYHSTSKCDGKKTRKQKRKRKRKKLVQTSSCDRTHSPDIDKSINARGSNATSRGWSVPRHRTVRRLCHYSKLPVRHRRYKTKHRSSCPITVNQTSSCHIENLDVFTIDGSGVVSERLNVQNQQKVSSPYSDIGFTRPNHFPGGNKIDWLRVNGVGYRNMSQKRPPNSTMKPHTGTKVKKTVRFNKDAINKKRYQDVSKPSHPAPRNPNLARKQSIGVSKPGRYKADDKLGASPGKQVLRYRTEDKLGATALNPDLKFTEDKNKNSPVGKPVTRYKPATGPTVNTSERRTARYAASRNADPVKGRGAPMKKVPLRYTHGRVGNADRAIKVNGEDSKEDSVEESEKEARIPKRQSQVDAHAHRHEREATNFFTRSTDPPTAEKTATDTEYVAMVAEGNISFIKDLETWRDAYNLDAGDIEADALKLLDGDFSSLYDDLPDVERLEVSKQIKHLDSMTNDDVMKL